VLEELRDKKTVLDWDLYLSTKRTKSEKRCELAARHPIGRVKGSARS
ncbi:7827_t:CDS:2, partial [Gigaspora rosea]